jgi:hypothetical protein
MSDVIAVAFSLRYDGAIKAHLEEMAKLATALKDEENRVRIDGVIDSFTLLVESKPADGGLYGAAVVAKSAEEAHEFQTVFGTYCSVDHHATFADDGSRVVWNQLSAMLCEPV